MLVLETFRKILKDFSKKRCGKFREFCEFECLGSLESLKTCEMREVISQDALYKRRNWMGVIPFKTQGEISAIGLTPHRWMWGTTCRLEQLMTPYGLWSVNSNHGMRKMALSCVQIKGQNNINAWKVKTPIFSSNEWEKIRVLMGYCRVKDPDNVLGLGS